MAEREGFEPPGGLLHHLISSQAHSATLPPLLSLTICDSWINVKSILLLLCLMQPGTWGLRFSTFVVGHSATFPQPDDLRLME